MQPSFIFSRFRYHVVFFDRLNKSVARAWIRTRYLMRLTEENSAKARKLNALGGGGGRWSKRLEQAEKEANEAACADLKERRDKYSFLNRYKGKWGLPWDLDLQTSDEEQEK